MRASHILVSSLLVLFLVACGGGDGSPTLVPTADVQLGLTEEAQQVDEGEGDQSPRATPDTGLPPTFTPEPTSAPATLEPTPEATEEGTVDVGEEGTYTVQAGDTLAEIAAEFNVSLDALVEANDIDNVDVIEVGQVLIIPEE